MKTKVVLLTHVAQGHDFAIAVQACQTVLHNLENADAPCLNTWFVHLKYVLLSAKVTKLRELTRDAHEHDVVKM